MKIYWNNLKDAGLIGEFSFIKVLKMTHYSKYLKVKSKLHKENETKILLEHKLDWMQNKLLTGDILKYFCVSVRTSK